MTSETSTSSSIVVSTSQPSPNSLTSSQIANINNVDTNSSLNSSTESSNSNQLSDITISDTNDIDSSGEEEPGDVMSGRSLDSSNNSSGIQEGSGNSSDGNIVEPQSVVNGSQVNVNSSDINPNNATTEESSDITNITVSDDQGQESPGTDLDDLNQTSDSKVIELNSTPPTSNGTSVEISFTTLHVENNDSAINGVSSDISNISSREHLKDNSTSNVLHSSVTKIANLSIDNHEIEITTIRNNIEQQLPLNTTQVPVPKTELDNDDSSNQSTTHITNTARTRIVSIEENVSIGVGSGEGSGEIISDSRQIFSDEEVER